MALLKRKESVQPTVIAVVPDSKSGSSGSKGSTPKKGHATPKRSEAQAARRTPIVASAAPTNRPLTKEEKAERRQKERVARDESYEGMKAGVEKHLPTRDRGAQRRYVRQYIDARRNIAEYFMPIVLIFLLVTLFTSQMGFVVVSMVLMLFFYLLLAIGAVDLYLMWKKLKSLLIAKFGEVEKGTAYYACMRAFQLRRMRLPQASTAYGDFPV